MDYSALLVPISWAIMVYLWPISWAVVLYFCLFHGL